jgi:hypothetical protein
MTTIQKTLNTIYDVLGELKENQILKRLPGNCILASDLIQNMLYSHGVNAKTVEVEVIFTRIQQEEGINVTHLLGYDNKNTTGNMFDTHVVVITQTNPPILVDATIFDILGVENLVIVEPLDKEADNSEILCELEVNGFNLVYRIKKNIKLPSFHQKDLVAKLKRELQIEKSIDFLKSLVFIAASVTVVNFIVNMLLIVLNVYFGTQ